MENSQSSSVSSSSAKVTNKAFLDQILQKLMAVPIEAKQSLRDHTPTATRLPPADIFRLCKLAEEAFLKQDALLIINKANLPINVCGDIHGQFCGLRRIFKKLGVPSKETRYLFLGDYVDRGPDSVETICLLFAFKVRFPKCIFLLRGNHEDSSINSRYGFTDECTKKYTRHEVHHAFVEAFNAMPVAALLANKVLAMHGGLSPHLKQVDDINRIRRPTAIPKEGLLTDLLWSDPGSDLPGWSKSRRKISVTYDDGVLERFCEKNSLAFILRGHEEVDNGHRRSANGRLITVFSAANYCDHKNTAAVLTLWPNLNLKFTLFRP